MRVETVTKSDLKKRGWTEAMIKRFAPLPDYHRGNPHNPDGPLMLLYEVARISVIEDKPEFKAMLETKRQKKQLTFEGVWYHEN